MLTLEGNERLCCLLIANNKAFFVEVTFRFFFIGIKLILVYREQGDPKFCMIW